MRTFWRRDNVMVSLAPTRMHLEGTTLRRAYDRVPMGFSHDLHRLPHFRRDGLERLAAAYPAA